MGSGTKSLGAINFGGSSGGNKFSDDPFAELLDEGKSTQANVGF